MVKQDLVNYFKRGVDSGHQIETLKQELLSEGWQKDVVEQAASEIIRNPKHSRKLFQNNIDGNGFNSQVDNRKAPVGIKIILALHFLIALGVIFVHTIKGIASSSIFLGIFNSNIITFSLVISIFLAIIPVFVGISIFKGKFWARFAGIGFGILGIVTEIYSLFSAPNVIGAGHLLIAIFIVIYLLINKKGKSYFFSK